MILDRFPLLRLRTSDVSLYDQGFINLTREWERVKDALGKGQVPKLRPATPTPNVKVKK